MNGYVILGLWLWLSQWLCNAGSLASKRKRKRKRASAPPSEV
jgi:hypothetical protein